jgi:hypothetical protein
MGFFSLGPAILMQPPFDISADLDTPVSTYLKLAPLRPRYLLESVEGGAHLARYSFLGSASVEFRLDATGMVAGGQRRPAGRDELLTAFRATLAMAPQLAPVIPDLPFRRRPGRRRGLRPGALLRTAPNAPRAPTTRWRPRLRTWRPNRSSSSIT